MYLHKMVAFRVAVVDRLVVEVANVAAVLAQMPASWVFVGSR